MMDQKTLGWIEIIGGALSILYSGGTGYGMMRFGMMNTAGGLAVTILSILFIIAGIHHLQKSR
ncbi:MAG: hypothetical protein AABW88_00690 [Nanoarchaeota archaeon]